MTRDKRVATGTGKAAAGRIAARAITEGEKGYARAAVRLKIGRAVWALWDRLREEEGVDQTWLVERLGSNKGRVSRLLNGPGNWTLDTVADLLEAMEGRLTAVEVKRYREVDAAARVEPSLSGLRDHPGLWNVVAVTIDPAQGAPALAQEPPLSAPPLRIAGRPRVVSSEAA